MHSHSANLRTTTHKHQKTTDTKVTLLTVQKIKKYLKIYIYYLQLKYIPCHSYYRYSV